MENARRIEPIMENWVLGFIVLNSRETNGRSQAAVERTQMSQTGQRTLAQGALGWRTALTLSLSPGRGDVLPPRWEESDAGESSSGARPLLPAHEPSFGARPVPGRSGSDGLLVPEPSPGRRLHSDPLRAGTSRAPDAGGFRGARRDKSSSRSLLSPLPTRASRREAESLRSLRKLLWIIVIPFQYVGLFFLMASTAGAAGNVSFSQPVETVEAYDYVEVIVRVDKPDARNPFLDVTVTGSFSKADGTGRKTVEGFCDSADGSVFRVRFMPASPGDYTWSVTYRQGANETAHTGGFKASAGV